MPGDAHAASARNDRTREVPPKRSRWGPARDGPEPMPDRIRPARGLSGQHAPRRSASRRPVDHRPRTRGRPSAAAQGRHRRWQQEGPAGGRNLEPSTHPDRGPTRGCPRPPLAPAQPPARERCGGDMRQEHRRARRRNARRVRSVRSCLGRRRRTRAARHVEHHVEDRLRRQQSHPDLQRRPLTTRHRRGQHGEGRDRHGEHQQRRQGPAGHCVQRRCCSGRHNSERKRTNSAYGQSHRHEP